MEKWNNLARRERVDKIAAAVQRLCLLVVIAVEALFFLPGETAAGLVYLSPVCLVVGFLAAFLSGLFACKVMISIVKKARLTWFALYCLVASLLLLVFA